MYNCNKRKYIFFNSMHSLLGRICKFKERCNDTECHNLFADTRDKSSLIFYCDMNRAGTRVFGTPGEPSTLCPPIPHLTTRNKYFTFISTMLQCSFISSKDNSYKENKKVTEQKQNRTKSTISAVQMTMVTKGAHS
jgi:hypothetical protein